MSRTRITMLRNQNARRIVDDTRRLTPNSIDWLRNDNRIAYNNEQVLQNYHTQQKNEKLRLELQSIIDSMTD